MKFIAYYRVSTDKQGQSGLGLEAQQAAVSAYVKGCQSELLNEFIEVESGKKAARPRLVEALRMCKLSNSTLIVAKLDRLSRDVAFLANLMTSKVKFVCADMPEANELTIHIMAAVAQDELRRISDRTKAALKAAKIRGTRLGNPQLERVRNTDTSAAVQARQRKAQEAALEVLPVIEHIKSQGHTSLRRIAGELNRLGITTPRGAEWQATSVKRVLMGV